MKCRGCGIWFVGMEAERCRECSTVHSFKLYCVGVLIIAVNLAIATAFKVWG